MTGASAAAGPPTHAAFLDAMERSWPSRDREQTPEGLVLRDDAPEAGSRVRSARLLSAPPDGSVADRAAERIETYYDRRGATPLYQAYREDPAALDQPVDALEARLQARGFDPFDPCVFVAASTAKLAEPSPEPATSELRLIEIRTPLATLNEIWREGGVGPERQAVMARAPLGGPEGGGGVLAARIGSRLEGAVFWAAPAGGTAFVHALHMAPSARRKGGAAALLRRAAQEAAEAGAAHLCAAIRIGNTSSRALFAKLGFVEFAAYVYWRKAPGVGAAPRTADAK